LNACCEQLGAWGFPWELPDSHAKVFVDPASFPAVSKSARSQSLKPLHVIVAARFEATVKQVIEALPKREKVKLRQTSPFTIEDEAASPSDSAESHCANWQVGTTRTFVHVHVPNSLCSTITSGPNTV